MFKLLYLFIEIHKEYVIHLEDKDGNINIIKEYAEKIKKFDSTYECPKVQTGACYIATAVYGSYDAPEVCTLRLFRDNYLAKRGWGRSFIKIYYKYSPKLIRSIKKNNILNVFFRNLLDKFVAKISLKY